MLQEPFFFSEIADFGPIYRRIRQVNGPKSRIWRYIARNGNTGCWLALGALSKYYQTCIVTNRRFFIKYSILLNEIGSKNQKMSESPDCLLFALTF